MWLALLISIINHFIIFLCLFFTFYKQLFLFLSLFKQLFNFRLLSKCSLGSDLYCALIEKINVNLSGKKMDHYIKC